MFQSTNKSPPFAVSKQITAGRYDVCLSATHGLLITGLKTFPHDTSPKLGTLATAKTAVLPWPTSFKGTKQLVQLFITTFEESKSYNAIFPLCFL